MEHDPRVHQSATPSWKPVGVFFGLSILLLALIPVLSITTGLTMDFDAAAAEATKKTGIGMTSNLLVVVRLAIAEPAIGLLILGSAIPALAALLVCLWTRRPSPLQLLARLRPFGADVPVAQAVRAYGLLFILVPLCLVGAYVLRTILPGSTEYVQGDGIFGWGLIVALFTAAFLDQGGVLEEIGWRGYAQPALQACLVTPLKAALIVGIAWGLWHLPRDVVGGVIGRLGFVQYTFLYLPSFLLGTVSVSVVAAYFMNRTGGSLLAGIMVHGLANDAVGLAGAVELNVALTPYHQITQNAVFFFFALVLIAISGQQLGRNTATPCGDDRLSK